MKIIIQAMAIALVIGSTGAASAAHARMHHKAAAEYNAISPKVQMPDPANDYRGWSYEPGESSGATATGGPVGGLGS